MYLLSSDTQFMMTAQGGTAVYLHALDGLAQPKKESAAEDLLLCRRDLLIVDRAAKQALELTERDWEEAMHELKECRKKLEAAYTALKAGQRSRRPPRKGPRRETDSSRP